MYKGEVSMKRRILIASGAAAVALVILFGVIGTVFMPNWMFSNNSQLQPEVNREIKTLVLQAVKDRCSSVYNVDREQIFDLDSENLIAAGALDSPADKSLFCIMDSQFMRSAAFSDGKYTVRVKMYYPESYYYEFIIEKQGDQYRITSFSIDI